MFDAGRGARQKLPERKSMRRTSKQDDDIHQSVRRSMDAVDEMVRHGTQSVLIHCGCGGVLVPVEKSDKHRCSKCGAEE